MNRKQSIVLLVVVVAIVLILYLSHRQSSILPSTKPRMETSRELKATQKIASQPANQTSLVTSNSTPTEVFSQAQMDRMKRDSEIEIAKWKSPILYYGKVVDEDGNPIQGAKASYNASALDGTFNQIQITGSVTSDERGIFKIDGINGYTLMLEVSHPDYYSYPDNSTGFSKGSLPRNGYYSDTEDKAEIFKMHHKGNPVPLITRSGGFHAPHDGIATNFPLRGNIRSEILGQLQIQGWSGLRTEKYPYDWKVQLAVPSGGIIETTNYFDYVAPESGYRNNISLEVGGSEGARRTFFLKLPTGYVRFKLNVIMGKDMFVSGDYFYNPDGSRNLEAGQVIHPTQ